MSTPHVLVVDDEADNRQVRVEGERLTVAVVDRAAFG